MRVALALLLVTAPLAGCVTSTLNTPHAVIERAEIDGELLYQATVKSLDAAQASGAMSAAAHDDAWRQAWADLQAFRLAYTSGQVLTGAIGSLQSDLNKAKAPKP